MKHHAKFHKYIEVESDFSSTEKDSIISSIDSVYNRKVLGLVLMLITWNIIALIIEWTILGGSILAALAHGMHWKFILPEIGFLLGNFSIKSFWVKSYMKKDLTWGDTFLSAIPSVGPFIILAKLIKDNPLVMKAVKSYAGYKKKKILKF